MTTVSGDTFLRERDYAPIHQPHPEPEVYTDWVSVAPRVEDTPPTITTDENGGISVEDTRPAPLVVETQDDGSITIKVPA